jgi:hypothetical protein
VGRGPVRQPNGIKAPIKQAAGATVEERLAMIDRVRAMQKKPSKMLSEDVVRELRNERIKRLTGRRA